MPSVLAATLLLLLVNGIQATGGGGRGHHQQHERGTPATKEREKWEACAKDRQCLDADCSSCTDDDLPCQRTCVWKCLCGCGGRPWGDKGYLVWEKCYAGCKRGHKACRSGCGDAAQHEDCADACWLERNKCSCQCSQAVSATTPARDRT
ncbi:uncharacterized protein LOC113208552 [Frankliniella occidentalis]|uniref:Uncharacterized protein LOC113208552 n=1 Tax=Frankliniella occidentalis TaxID=133901 RepID=A0A6J1SPY3_FRAOC|nr:uncharacterized protein LOC113208552 [Frankliniella occidentalis]